MEQILDADAERKIETPTGTSLLRDVLAQSLGVAQLASPLSHLAIAKLRSSGITPDQALAAGIYSVESAREEVHPEFPDVPALVFPYHDMRGKPIFVERDEDTVQFVRIRRLADPPATGFAKPKQLPKYQQLKGTGVHAYFPKVTGFDWSAIANDPAINLVFTEGELKSLAGCLAGVATIGLGGVDSFVRKAEQGA